MRRAPIDSLPRVERKIQSSLRRGPARIPSTFGQRLLPMNSLDSSRFIAAAARVDDDAARVAEVLVSAWQHRLAALAPIVGQRGVGALYGRSLALASASHPWLAAAQLGVKSAVDLPALSAALSSQTAAEAAAGDRALAKTLSELLASLIGASLTERLLGSMTDPVPGATAHERSS